jgi:hypothetical protein
VFSGHVRLPIKPRPSRASVGECASPTLHGPPHPPPQVLAALPASTYLVCAACHCYTSTVVYGSQRGVQVAESVDWRVTDCARATAMVVKRKTRNNGNTHHQPVVPRVQPLLKYAPSFAPNP